MSQLGRRHWDAAVRVKPSLRPTGGNYRRVRHGNNNWKMCARIRAQQRQRRESVPVATCALVGYTNAGKSTLFNALTQASVFESPKMFATLDPTIRGVVLPSRPQVLLSTRRIHS